MYNLNTVHKTVNNLILPTTVIFCLTFGLYYKLDLLVPLVQANVPKVADFPFRNRVKSQVVANATNTYLDVPYINQCKDFENSPLWPDAIGSTAGRKICENMCGAASSVMLLSYFGNYPNDPNNPRVLRNRMTDSRPEITDEQRDGNASFGGAFAVTSEGMGNQSDGNNIVSLFNRYRYMSINSSGNEINNIDGNGYKFFYEQTSSSLIYNRVKIAIDRGNPVIVSTARHIRLVIGYDNQGKIIANDPWNNNSRTNNEIASLDGKFVKYGSNIKLLGQSDPKIYDEWRWTLEFTPTKPPDVKQFVHGQRVKAFQKFSDDPIEGLNVRTTPGGSVIRRIPWKSIGTITWGPSYGGLNWAYKVRFDIGIEGWVSEIYIKDINYNPTVGSYTVDQKVFSKIPDGVNIREEPSVGGKLIKFQPSQQTGKATRRVDNITDYNWYYVEWSDGTKGWSAIEFLNTSYVAPRKIGKDSWINWDTNLRELNTTDSKAIRRYPKGTYVWSIEEAGNANGFEWVMVTVSEPPFWAGGAMGNPTKTTGFMIKQNINEAWVAYDRELYSKDVPYLTKKTVDPNAESLNVRESPNGTSKITDTLPWDKEVKIIDGVTYSYGYNRVKITYQKQNPFISWQWDTFTGWVPVEFLQKK